MSELIWAEHSAFTDPGDYRFLYDALPLDIPFLRELCSRFFLHYTDMDLNDFKYRYN